MDEAQRAHLAKHGYVRISGAVPPPLLASLSAVLDRHVDAWKLERQAEAAPPRTPADSAAPPVYGDSRGFDDPHSGYQKVTADGSWQKVSTDESRQPGNDGQRWAPANGLPLDEAWADPSAGTHPFRDLLTLPPVHAVLQEILGDPAWGHILPAVPPSVRTRYRLDHDYVNVTPAHDAARGPPRIPPPNPPGLHGSVTSYHVTVVFELLDVYPGDGGFGCLAGSHLASYERPSHTGWELPPWESSVGVTTVANCTINANFSRKLSIENAETTENCP